MSKLRFFAYCPDDGFDVFETAEQAKAAAEQWIDSYRGDAVDGWSEEVDQVCWGEIREKATQVGRRPATEEDVTSCDYFCDYQLQRVGRKP